MSSSSSSASPSLSYKEEEINLNEIDESILTESQKDYLHQLQEDEEESYNRESVESGPYSPTYGLNGELIENSRKAQLRTVTSNKQSRRRSLMHAQSVKSIETEANPLANAGEVEKILLRVENLSGCRPITSSELNEMIHFFSQLE